MIYLHVWIVIRMSPNKEYVDVSNSREKLITSLKTSEHDLKRSEESCQVTKFEMKFGGGGSFKNLSIVLSDLDFQYWIVLHCCQTIKFISVIKPKEGTEHRHKWGEAEKPTSISTWLWKVWFSKIYSSYYPIRRWFYNWPNELFSQSGIKWLPRFYCFTQVCKQKLSETGNLVTNKWS